MLVNEMLNLNVELLRQRIEDIRESKQALKDLLAPHSSASTTGATRSPRISPVPTMQPSQEGGLSGSGGGVI